MADEKCEQEMGINVTKRMPLACEETLKDRRWETVAIYRSAGPIGAAGGLKKINF